jgi:hypothetical protein
MRAVDSGGQIVIAQKCPFIKMTRPPSKLWESGFFGSFFFAQGTLLQESTPSHNYVLTLEEEVYIEQPEGFQLSENTDYVCKLKKALYGLKQAPRAWYSRLDKYLQQAGFRKRSADNNLYIKVSQGNILLIEVYVDDIIFGSDDDRLSQKFAKDMQNEFEMSLLGELSFFLGLQIRQSNQGIFISQTKYIREMLKRFGMED